MHAWLFAGVDTHKNSLTVAASDSYFATLDTLTFANSFNGFMEKLVKIAKSRTCLFGLEHSQGLGNLLAEFLLKKGFSVLGYKPHICRQGKTSCGPHKISQMTETCCSLLKP
jgi:transposase